MLVYAKVMYAGLCNYSFYCKLKPENTDLCRSIKLVVYAGLCKKVVYAGLCDLCVYFKFKLKKVAYAGLCKSGLCSFMQFQFLL